MNEKEIFELFNKKKIIIAGPCAVESQEQILEIAKELKELGVDFLRGGCYKPRTNPNSFQGLEEKGLEYIIEAKRITNLPIVVELTSEKYLDKYIKDIDIIQVGARNMQNFELLKELGKTNKPILLKRGLCATYKEWKGAIEYILQGGNNKIILCERGIRTFETETRNTLDLQAVPIMKEKTKLPIIIDPSHSAGRKDIIQTMCKGAFAVGADGIIVEVHNNPSQSLCDKEQALSIGEFKNIMESLKNERYI